MHTCLSATLHDVQRNFYYHNTLISLSKQYTLLFDFQMNMIPSQIRKH